ncbi:MAG TPA: YfhO family protein, partial [Puia sp.]|nr:YfhO family protein [Puia sp.]
AWDSSASIKLIENLNDKISYAFSAKTNQFAVFSEVYYDKGWDAYLDGKKTDYVKVDYILRGMAVPAGDHKIEFRFEPKSYVMGNTISLIACLLTYLLIILAGVTSWKKKNLV